MRHRDAARHLLIHLGSFLAFLLVPAAVLAALYLLGIEPYRDPSGRY